VERKEHQHRCAACGEVYDCRELCGLPEPGQTFTKAAVAHGVPIEWMCWVCQ